ncbi:DDRGK domain-containing protein 1-like [Pyrus ussuriensis x Pyrus communis]|uniref:DDRGK domain-containing protein 1-like n=1 Tax=Pyrus ussuriensis x Pyrus communis TaxID=2448454 RepID=A0A5N5IA19_9ROSA|nr:DDRGK domain-containing protein 1-like [Pyrus ussuriensis x Pyrus communis]
MARFNSFAWGSISLEQLHDSFSFVALRRDRGGVKGDGKGNEEEEEEKEEGNEFVWTASSLNVCTKMVWLENRHHRSIKMSRYEDVKRSNDDNEMVIYIPEGQHVGTKMKVLCTRATSKSVRTKIGQN